MKSWLGDTGTEVAAQAFGVARKRLTEGKDAVEAEKRALTMAKAAVIDLQRFSQLSMPTMATWRVEQDGSG